MTMIPSTPILKPHSRVVSNVPMAILWSGSLSRPGEIIYPVWRDQILARRFRIACNRFVERPRSLKLFTIVRVSCAKKDMHRQGLLLQLCLDSA